MLTDAIIRQLKEITDGNIHLDVPLSRYTSFEIGGPADVLLEPSNTEQVSRCVDVLASSGIPWIVLGAGTNVLFHDKGFRGVVIRTKRLNEFYMVENGGKEALFFANAGVTLFKIIGLTAKHEFRGLEPLWGIPGNFGGAVMTNAGAGSVNFLDNVEELTVISREGRTSVVKIPELDHGYRKSGLTAHQFIVSGILRLTRGNKKDIQAGMRSARSMRVGKQPWDQPSAGCIFKNPTRDKSAGLLIDRAGLKGSRVGGALVSLLHGNFIVNTGRAKASDVLELIDRIKERVFEMEQIMLETELHVVPEVVSP